MPTWRQQTKNSPSAFSAIVSSSCCGTEATGSPTRPVISLSARTCRDMEAPKHGRRRKSCRTQDSGMEMEHMSVQQQQAAGGDGDSRQGAAFRCLVDFCKRTTSSTQEPHAQDASCGCVKASDAAEAPACTRAHAGGCELPQLIEGRHFHCFH